LGNSLESIDTLKLEVGEAFELQEMCCRRAGLRGCAAGWRGLLAVAGWFSQEGAAHEQLHNGFGCSEAVSVFLFPGKPQSRLPPDVRV